MYLEGPNCKLKYNLVLIILQLQKLTKTIKRGNIIY